MDNAYKNIELEIGKNYANEFGLDPEKQAMIYNGGISWTAKEGDREMTKDSQETTDNLKKTFFERGGSIYPW